MLVTAGALICFCINCLKFFRNTENVKFLLSDSLPVVVSNS